MSVLSEIRAAKQAQEAKEKWAPPDLSEEKRKELKKLRKAAGKKTFLEFTKTNLVSHVAVIEALIATGEVSQFKMAGKTLRKFRTGIALSPRFLEETIEGIRLSPLDAAELRMRNAESVLEQPLVPLAGPPLGDCRSPLTDRLQKLSTVLGYLKEMDPGYSIRAILKKSRFQGYEMEEFFEMSHRTFCNFRRYGRLNPKNFAKICDLYFLEEWDEELKDNPDLFLLRLHWVNAESRLNFLSGVDIISILFHLDEIDHPRIFALLEYWAQHQDALNGKCSF